MASNSRTKTVTAVLLAFASTFVAVSASAETEKGTREGGGAAAGGGSGLGVGSTTTPRDQSDASGDVVARDPSKKIWEVGISSEYHRLFIQNDLEGAAANKNLMVYAASVEVDPTPKDRIRLRGFLYERFLADPGETGVRSDDLILSYTRYQPLPYEMTLKPGAWLTAPTSFTSQKASLITAPRLYVALDKAFGKWVHVEPRVSGDFYWVRYGTVDQGATPNTEARFGMGINAEVTMPFHPQLTIGADAGTAYYAYYHAIASQAGGGNPSFPGTVTDPNYVNQPVQQTYGFEVYARYDFSRFRPERAQDLHWDLTVSAANGDPAIGYASAIHDGSLAVYWGFRQTAQAYAVLAARY